VIAWAWVLVIASFAVWTGVAFFIGAWVGFAGAYCIPPGHPDYGRET
jgi:hypothetical protein